MSESANIEKLRAIRTFPQLVDYLHYELEWPIGQHSFEDLTYEYEPEELGIKAENAAKVKEIKQLRPLDNNQPWGVFFIKFEPKKLPLVVLKTILAHLTIKKRATATGADKKKWEANDLLFISSYGEEDGRDVTFVHFAIDPKHPKDLPVLQVIDWDRDKTALHLQHADKTLKTKLAWPKAGVSVADWRKQWSSAFQIGQGYAVKTASDLAATLAALAVRIRDQVKEKMAAESEKGPFRKLLKDFQKTLLHSLDEEGFADMYAQTITYGLLSVAVSKPAGFDAGNLPDMVAPTNPFLKSLFEEFLTVGGRKGKIDYDAVGMNEVVQALRGIEDVGAVLRDFGDQNMKEDPVLYFYEHFLTAYNKKLKFQRGVFYTPKPVVSYIVRSVHELLQTEFGLADGLADTATWADMLAKHKDLKLPEVEVKDEKTNKTSKQPIDPKTSFVQILDPVN
jgi:hypothetical protein